MKRLLLGFALMLAPVAQAATFLVTVDTSTLLPSTAGILSLDYSTQNAQSSFAAITGFAGATLGSALPPIGTVSGGLATDDLVLTATNPGSNFATNATFNASSMTFTLSLYGPAIETPDSGSGGTTFSIMMYLPTSPDPTPLLTADGIVGLIDIAGDGTITTSGFGITTFDENIPEPSTLLTMAAGVAALAVLRRRSA